MSTDFFPHNKNVDYFPYGLAIQSGILQGYGGLCCKLGSMWEVSVAGFVLPPYVNLSWSPQSEI